MLDALGYWAELGVDAFRLDAVPYLIEQDGTNCENLPGTHEVIRDIRRHVDEALPRPHAARRGEPVPDDVRPYFGDGDECHMAFHFPLMPRIFMALRLEDVEPVVEIMRRTADPDACQWALFLRNHDELTPRW